MKAKKIIFEIDGERHRLVRGKAFVGNMCSKCSLADLCTEVVGSPCLHSWDYFVKEKEQKPKPMKLYTTRQTNG